MFFLFCFFQLLLGSMLLALDNQLLTWAHQMSEGLVVLPNRLLICETAIKASSTGAAR